MKGNYFDKKHKVYETTIVSSVTDIDKDKDYSHDSEQMALAVW